MKLILRQYLANLRERKELDALLPDLLSQMGLDVFSKPGLGGRQYGVDIAAYGQIDNGPETVYLLSVKSGNLGRSDWNGGSVQDLKPSLDEIINTYIPTHLPSKYKNKPIEICLCFGGDLKEAVRLNVSTYQKKHQTDSLSFSEWNGEIIANYIERYLLREELLPEQCRPLLRKSLALLDEPESSYSYFSQLIRVLENSTTEKPSDTLTAMRQMNICLWILYSWCREEGNVESAYLSSELVTLHAWEMAKSFIGQKNKLSIDVFEVLHAIQILHIQISNDYLEDNIFPHTHKLYALSGAVSASCAIDVNLKLFDILGRIATSAAWSYWYYTKIPHSEENAHLLEATKISIDKHQVALVQLIANNPVLLSPCKDDQSIDITLAAWIMGLEQAGRGELHVWLFNMMHRVTYLLNTENSYPCILQSYHEIIEHPQPNKDGYFEEVTAGSILYPTVAAFSALLGFKDVYSLIREIQTDLLSHCNFQIWFPDKNSEQHLYLNDAIHGATLSGVKITENQDDLIALLFDECKESHHFGQLSAMSVQHWPLILMACRHYRLPVPIHFLQEFLPNKNKAAKKSSAEKIEAIDSTE